MPEKSVIFLIITICHVLFCPPAVYQISEPIMSTFYIVETGLTTLDKSNVYIMQYLELIFSFFTFM